MTMPFNPKKIHLHWEVSTLYFGVRLQRGAPGSGAKPRTRNPGIPRCAIAHLRSGANAPSSNDEAASAVYLDASTRFNPTSAGSEPVGNGSALTVPGGNGALAVASGNRVRISRRKPSVCTSTSTVPSPRPLRNLTSVKSHSGSDRPSGKSTPVRLKE